MNRTLFRGAAAAVMAGALVTGGTIAGTALAATAAPASPEPPVTPSAGSSVHATALPLLRRMYPFRPVKHVKPKRRVQRAASRTEHRVALIGSPREIAHAMLLRDGWSESQWSCLDALWTRESNWNTYAENRSGAYGIPQALPGYKMSAMGSDWRTNPITQIRWGLSYIANAYGSPCNALAHSNSYNYY